MGSFTQLSYHVVFGTKYRAQSITESIQDRLYEYIGGTIRAKKGELILKAFAVATSWLAFNMDFDLSSLRDF